MEWVMDDTIEVILIYQYRDEEYVYATDSPADKDVAIPLNEIIWMSDVIMEGENATIELQIPVWLAEEKEFI